MPHRLAERGLVKVRRTGGHEWGEKVIPRNVRVGLAAAARAADRLIGQPSRLRRVEQPSVKGCQLPRIAAASRRFIRLLRPIGFGHQISPKPRLANDELSATWRAARRWA